MSLEEAEKIIKEIIKRNKKMMGSFTHNSPHLTVPTQPYFIIVWQCSQVGCATYY
ncbi:hypothetical protein [Mycoplasma phage sp.]|nr:hypothetical protein [Mycoplasma phage sp.]